MEIKDSGCGPTVEGLIPTWGDELLFDMLRGSFMVDYWNEETAALMAEIQPALLAEARRRCQRPAARR